MTSRETTAFLPRVQRVAGVSRRRKWENRIAVWQYAMIQWPWLLKSLWGGSRASKAALLQRLELPADALPNLGSWKADTGLLALLVDHIECERPNIVVEFGMGASTLILAKAIKRVGCGRLISFDQHADFVSLTRAWLAQHGLDADLRAAPLTPSSHWPGLWYDHDALPAKIDLLIIDGPPWTIHPFTRGAADSLFDRIAPGGAIILDDAARPGERLIARRWQREWPEFDWLFMAGIKGALIGRRQ